ncbi:MAG TPA: N-acetylglucosamine-6-phosphate deacetylase [Pyrinomonadaceae bacterium]|nr:N-acetylglucosamine-6-phosphate deacetylase [Pyrinomonadaceae bacterium]
MSSLTLSNAVALVGDELVDGATIVVEGERIDSVKSVSTAGPYGIDCADLRICPGSIDVHIHGAVGADVNATDVDGLVEIARFLARKGVTAWVPTLVPDSDENYARVIGEIDRLMEIQTEEPIAQAVGVHYEGVFASEKMCGALRPQYFKTFSGTELASLPRLKNGVHMTTYAPEVDGGIELTRELIREGWIASIGHTKASTDVLDGAFEAGVRHLTHFFNAMTGLHHRDLGVVGWALTNPDVTFDIIADGVHVHPTMLAFACRLKSPRKITLISDSVSPTGLGDGEFEIWGEKISVINGRTENERGSIAGSVITMHEAALQMKSLGFTPSEVTKMTSLNPAKLLGIESSRGSIAVGKRADFVGIDREGNVRLTVIGGRVAFDAR